MSDATEPGPQFTPGPDEFNGLLAAIARAGLVFINHPDPSKYEVAPAPGSQSVNADLYAALGALMEYEPVRAEFQPTNKGDLQFKSAMGAWQNARAALLRARGEKEPR